jgi:aminopeptidase-like protein
MASAREFEQLIASATDAADGEEMHSFMRTLFPIARSLTGDGVRRTLCEIARMVSLNVIEVPSGTKCFDWVVPNEWLIRDAYVKDRSGRRVIDWRENSLHVVGYSTAVAAHMTLGELRPHLHTLPDQPDAIPYLTSYYSETWGFCVSQRLYETLNDESYEVRIDSELHPGQLTLGEGLLRGRSDREIFFSTNICHPTMANNELSGPVLLTFLYRALASLSDRRYTYRFAFVPETIGAIAYLWLKGEQLKAAVDAGYVVTCAGDPGPFTYKRSRRSSTLADRAAEHVLATLDTEKAVIVRDFVPIGSDERQYCSLGFDLPVGSLMRSMYGTYPEYHTSRDDLSLVKAESLAESLMMILRVVEALEFDRTYLNLAPWGEPQLSRRGLYPVLGGRKQNAEDARAILWMLSRADGAESLLDIARRANLPVSVLAQAAEQLVAADLLKEL